MKNAIEQKLDSVPYAKLFFLIGAGIGVVIGIVVLGFELTIGLLGWSHANDSIEFSWIIRGLLGFILSPILGGCIFTAFSIMTYFPFNLIVKKLKCNSARGITISACGIHSFLKFVKRILICMSAIAFIILILWLVIESILTQYDIFERRLQDWPFTVSFYIFILSTTSWAIIGPFSKIKNKVARVILTIISCTVFIIVSFFGGLKKFSSFGDKAYANQQVYLKYYYNFMRPDSYYLYKTDGILFIKEGEKPQNLDLYLFHDDIDGYIEYLKKEENSRNR